MVHAAPALEVVPVLIMKNPLVMCHAAPALHVIIVTVMVNPAGQHFSIFIQIIIIFIIEEPAFFASVWFHLH